MMSQRNGGTVAFDDCLEGRTHRCVYRVIGTRLAVATGGYRAVADLDRMEPIRLARILVHDLLVCAALRTPGTAADGP
ncbi:MAG TPA: hypothetical protein VHC94_13360 [Nitrobacter sp.]|jgi:hypothetical protein|nr:hypothetical protein [Nitrobacter sp.]